MNTVRASIESRATTDYERYEAYNRYESIWQDETTWVAETLCAPLCKELTYQLHNGELYSSEGQRLADIFDSSLSYYETYRRMIDPRAEFQYQRALLEREELAEMQSMAVGEGPNTLVVFSTYPQELENSLEDYLGYQHARKLGFIRVITRNNDGAISMWTQSFDGNYKPGIEAMYQEIGGSVDWAHDPLGQRVRVNLSEEQSGLLRDRLLYAYDASLYETYGGRWFAGRSRIDEQEAIRFVDSQRDLIKVHVEAVLRLKQDHVLLDNQRYDFAMAMRRRYEGVDNLGITIEHELSDAGTIGRENGETVSGCGVTISGDNETQSELSEAGYKLPEIYEGQELIDYCMTCPSCRRQKGVKVQKIRGTIYYSCLNDTCKSTTLPGRLEKSEHLSAIRNDRQQSPREQSSPVSPDNSDASEMEIDDIVQAIYGLYAKLEDSIAFGGRYYRVIDGRDGTVLAESYDRPKLH